MKFDLSKELNLPSLSQQLAEIQKGLIKAVESDNKYLSEPSLRQVTAPSKRLRSALVLAAAGGNQTKETIKACVCVELLHLGSLVHDDIMDNANTRWGRPTINKVEGVNTAILVGDYIFARANYLAATISPEVAQIVAETIVNLCQGQATELADVNNIGRTEADYITAISAKTGSLLAAACKIGALGAGLGKERVKALGNFGQNFGLAFQILDDVLDFVSTDELLGKSVGNDIKEGVYTMPIILALRTDHKDELLRQISSQNRSVDNYLLKNSIDKSITEAKRYNLKAVQSLKGPNKNNLDKLPGAYFKWALENLVPTSNTTY